MVHHLMMGGHWVVTLVQRGRTERDAHFSSPLTLPNLTYIHHNHCSVSCCAHERVKIVADPSPLADPSAYLCVTLNIYTVAQKHIDPAGICRVPPAVAGRQVTLWHANERWRTRKTSFTAIARRPIGHSLCSLHVYPT